MYRTLKLGPQDIGEVPVSDAVDLRIRRAQNIRIAAIYVGRALSRFDSRHAFTPEERYRICLSEITRTVVGFADEETIEEVRHRYEGGDPHAYLANMTRRASGRSVCEICGKEYIRHPEETRIQGANLLCNGDLVHL